MHAQFTALAQASVLQLRDALRRATARPGDRAEIKSPAEAEGVEAVADLRWCEWQETNFDVRHIHA